MNVGKSLMSNDLDLSQTNITKLSGTKMTNGTRGLGGTNMISEEGDYLKETFLTMSEDERRDF